MYGRPVDYYAKNNKMPYRDPNERLSRVGQGFSRMLATVKPDMLVRLRNSRRTMFEDGEDVSPSRIEFDVPNSAREKPTSASGSRNTFSKNRNLFNKTTMLTSKEESVLSGAKTSRGPEEVFPKLSSRK